MHRMAGAQGSRTTLSDEELSIIGRLGYEPTDEDRYLLATLGDGARQSLFVRLEAMADRLQGVLDVKAASVKAGVSVPTFYRLMKAWAGRRERGLGPIAGIAGRRPRGLGRDKDRSVAIDRAKALLGGDLLTDLPVKTLARLVRKASDDTVSVTAAETIVRDVRLQRSRGELEADRSFGRDLLLDACAISMAVIDPEDMTPRLVVVATLMEVSTGLLLSGIAATEDGAVRAQAAAMRRGSAAVERLGIDVARREPTRLTVVVGPALDPASDRFVEVLNSTIGTENVKAKGPRRYGRRTIRVIGRAIDRLQLLPASTEGGKADAADARAIGEIPVPPHEAQLILDRSLAKHNEPILAMLRNRSGGGEPASGRTEGRMREVLEGALPVTSGGFRF